MITVKLEEVELPEANKILLNISEGPLKPFRVKIPYNTTLYIRRWNDCQEVALILRKTKHGIKWYKLKEING